MLHLNIYFYYLDTNPQWFNLKFTTKVLWAVPRLRFNNHKKGKTFLRLTKTQELNVRISPLLVQEKFDSLGTRDDSL